MADFHHGATNNGVLSKCYKNSINISLFPNSIVYSFRSLFERPTVFNKLLKLVVTSLTKLV